MSRGTEVVFMRLHLINNKCFLSPDAARLKNQVFQLWQDEWPKIYSEKGSSHHPTADSFFRYDILMALFNEDALVGMTAHSFLDLHDDSSLNVEFFKSYGSSFKEKLLSEGISRLVTFESLLVDPKQRQRLTRSSYSQLLARLGNELLKVSHAQAMCAIARSDNRVSELAQSIGYHIFQKDIECRAFPCDVIILFPQSSKPLARHEAEVKAIELWDTSARHTGTPGLDWTKESVDFKRVAS